MPWSPRTTAGTRRSDLRREPRCEAHPACGGCVSHRSTTRAAHVDPAAERNAQLHGIASHRHLAHRGEILIAPLNRHDVLPQRKIGNKGMCRDGCVHFDGILVQGVASSRSAPPIRRVRQTARNARRRLCRERTRGRPAVGRSSRPPRCREPRQRHRTSAAAENRRYQKCDAEILRRASLAILSHEAAYDRGPYR